MDEKSANRPKEAASMNETPHPWYITVQTFPDLLHRNATEYGNRRAQWWKTKGKETDSLTYAQLEQTVHELSAGLMQLGLVKGDRACIMANTRPEWVWADYAILGGAAVTVCIYPSVSPAEIKHIVNDSGARFVFVDNKENLEKIKSAWKEMPTLEKAITIEGGAASTDERVISLDNLRALGRTLL